LSIDQFKSQEVLPQARRFHQNFLKTFVRSLLQLSRKLAPRYLSRSSSLLYLLLGSKYKEGILFLKLFYRTLKVRFNTSFRLGFLCFLARKQKDLLPIPLRICATSELRNSQSMSFRHQLMTKFFLSSFSSSFQRSWSSKFEVHCQYHRYLAAKFLYSSWLLTLFLLLSPSLFFNQFQDLL